MRYDEICKMCLQAFNLFSIVFLASIICLLANNEETPGKTFHPREVKDRSESSLCQALQMATVICGIIGPGSWANCEPLP